MRKTELIRLPLNHQASSVARGVVNVHFCGCQPLVISDVPRAHRPKDSCPRGRRIARKGVACYVSLLHGRQNSRQPPADKV